MSDHPCLPVPLFSCPDPAPEVIGLERHLVEVLLNHLEDKDPLSGEVTYVRQLLAAEPVKLWCTWSPGPNELHPFLSKEDAAKNRLEVIKACDEAAGRGKERGEKWAEHYQPPTIELVLSPFFPEDHFKVAAEEYAEHYDDLHRAFTELQAKYDKLLAEK